MFRKISTAALLVALSATALAVVAQKVAKDLDDAINEASNWVDWKPDDSMYPKEDGKKALEDGKTCIDKIDDALSKGLAASTVVETNKGTMTISEAREMCVAVRAAGQKVFGDLTEAEEALYEPFRKILSGDKLGLYNDRLKKYKLYGAGGKVLKTPEDYRNSPLWCSSGVDRDGIVPVWTVDCWHFKGMTKVGSVESRTGTGDEAPSSAFRYSMWSVSKTIEIGKTRSVQLMNRTNEKAGSSSRVWQSLRWAQTSNWSTPRWTKQTLQLKLSCPGEKARECAFRIVAPSRAACARLRTLSKDLVRGNLASRCSFFP